MGMALAKRFLIAQLKPVLMPALNKQGLEWEDALRMLNSIDLRDLKDTFKEVVKIFEAASAKWDSTSAYQKFCQLVTDKSGLTEKCRLMMTVRPILEEKLRLRHLRWPDVVLALQGLSN